MHKQYSWCALHWQSLVTGHLAVKTALHFPMAPKHVSLDSTHIRKCIVFPAEGSEPRLVNMTTRLSTNEDVVDARLHRRTVDLRATYGSEYLKMRVWAFIEYVPGKYMFYLNMSPKLPLNRCVARIVGENLDNLESQLFWRGDVVVMKFNGIGNDLDSQDADTSVISGLEYILKDAYLKGMLASELTRDETRRKLGQ